MTIQSTDIVTRLSGGASNSSVAASLGGAESTSGAPANIWGTVTAGDAVNGRIKYRCRYVHNSNATDTLTGVTASVQSDTPDSQTVIDIGVGTSAVAGTEQAIGSELSAPTGVTFGAGPVTLGDLAPGQFRAIWERLTVSAGAPAVTGDPYTLRVQGTTVSGTSNANRGLLTLASTLALTGVTSANGVTPSPDGKNLYVICNSSPGKVVQLSVNQTTGALTQGTTTTTANGPRRAAIPPDGLNLYVAGTGYGFIGIYSRSTSDGSLTHPLTDISYNNEVPMSIAASPDNAHVYVTLNSGTNGNMIRVYQRDMANLGNLIEIQQVALTAAFGLAVSPDGNAVYATSSSANTLSWYSRDNNPASGTYGKLTLVTSIAGTLSFPDSVGVSDDSQYIYVACDSSPQLTGCFKRNTTNNTLTDIGSPANTVDNNGGPWAVAMSRDTGSNSVYIAISDAQRIAQYDRNVNGTLTAKTPGSVVTSNRGATNTSSAGPYDIVVSPDNKFLFATALSTNSVDVFTIDQGIVTSTVTKDFVSSFDIASSTQTFVPIPALAIPYSGGTKVIPFGTTQGVAVANAPYQKSDKTWWLDVDPDDINYVVANLTRDLTDRGTTAVSVDFIATGCTIKKPAYIDSSGNYGVVQVQMDNTSPTHMGTFRVTCANSERFDRTIYFNTVDN